jgi:pyrimidine operon attenuation protein/uracil phosphoribosyltransferase
MTSRRHFIICAAIATGGAVAGIHFYRSNKMSSAELAVNEIVERLVKLPGAVRFGEMFRKQHLKHHDSMISAKSISERLFKDIGDLNHKSIEATLEKQIQIDLRKKQVFLVDDWYLTRIEAELCALASLTKTAT